MKTEYFDRLGYLLFVISGQGTQDEAFSTLDQIKEETQSRNVTRLFLDLRALQPPKHEFSRYLVGKYLAWILRPPIKVAAFSNSESVNRFVEDTAANRGAWIKVFTAETHALEWLLGER